MLKVITIHSFYKHNLKNTLDELDQDGIAIFRRKIKDHKRGVNTYYVITKYNPEDKNLIKAIKESHEKELSTQEF